MLFFPQNTLYPLHTGGKIRIKNVNVSRTLFIQFLYTLFDTIPFSHDMIRFSYDTKRFSHGTMRFLYDKKVARFINAV